MDSGNDVFKEGDLVVCKNSPMVPGGPVKDQVYTVERVYEFGDGVSLKEIDKIWDISRFKLAPKEFDWKNTSWYIPIENQNHLDAVIKFLRDLGYDASFIDDLLDADAEFVTCLTNTYAKGRAEKFLMHSTNKDLSRQETYYGSTRVDLKYETVNNVVAVEVHNKRQVEIRKIEEEIRKLTEKLAELVKRG